MNVPPSARISEPSYIFGTNEKFTLLHNWSELYIAIHTALKQFPKRDAHGIGTRIETLILNMLEYLLLASKKTGSQRVLLLEKLDRELVQAKILVRLSNRIKALSDGRYIEIEKKIIEKKIIEMGKMTGGWIKTENTNKKEAE